MEFGVLELGLRNKQIANISCFLRIQTEAFRVNWAQKCDTHSYSVLFDQWIDVFNKIIIIMNATLKETVSNADKHFGSKLARITLQTCFKLLASLCIEPNKSELQEQRKLFLQNLNKVIDKIRAIVKGDKQEPDVTEVVSDAHAYPDEWHSLSTNNVILDAVRSNKLPLAICYLKCIRDVDVNWKLIVQLVYSDLIMNLQPEKFTEFTRSLSQINIPVQKGVNDMFLNIADSSLQSFLYSKLEIPQKLMLREKQWWEQLNLIEEVCKDYDLHLNINVVKHLDNCRIQDVLISPLREDENYEFGEKTLKYLTPKVVWQCLVNNNDIKLLRKWISNNEENASRTYFPFNWTVTPEMLSFLHNNCENEYLKENILCCAALKGLFCDEELKFTNVIVRRLLRCNFIADTPTLLDHPSHPLKLLQSYDFNDFQQKLVDYALHNNMYHFLYWYTNIDGNKRFLVTSQVNSSVKDVLNACITYKENPSDEWSLFNYILMTAKHVYNLQSPANLQSLLDCGLSQLAVLALQYSPKGIIGAIEVDSDHISYANRNSLLKSLKTNYPLLYQAFVNVLHSEQSNQESPDVYTLLKDTTDFDISKLFCWQTSNVYRNLENSAFIEVPSFSSPRLAAKYGFKANLTAIYYLNRGRPVEAYFKWLKENGSSEKEVERGCKKASLLAFYNCSDKTIASACVVFVELLSSNSLTLRLHLSVANLVMSYSANFLGFEPRNQLQELGNLLKKACYHDDKWAAKKLYQLMVAAFNRKYSTDSESMLNECFEYKIAINFCKHYKLEPPIDFLVKCAQSDDWLLFTFFAQLYDIPNTVVMKILTGTGSDSFNNKCIAEHLEKAFQLQYLQRALPKQSSDLANMSRLVSNVNRSRNTLLQRIGVKKEKAKQKPVQTKPSSLGDDDRASVISDDMTIAETSSVISSSMYSEYFEGLNLDVNHPPKDLFSLILKCQKSNPVEPWKPLLTSSIILSNPIAALLAASIQDADSDSVTNSMFDCFCCWLFASFDFPNKNGFNGGEPCIAWGRQQFLSLMKSALIFPENYRIVHIGFEIFKLTNNPLTDLISFFIQFLEEKEFHASVKLLKTFQEKLWNYECLDEDSFALNSKRLIEETSVIILGCAVKAIRCAYQLHILLRYLDFSRLQSTFNDDIPVPDFHKMYRLSQCLENTTVTLNVSLFVDAEEESEEYKSSLLKVVYSLQELEYFNEAIQFATICNLNAEVVSINEWTVKANKRKEEFTFWKDAFQSLESAEVCYAAITAFVEKFIEGIDCLLSKSYVLAKLVEYFVKTSENPNEVTLFEKSLWEICLRIEMERSTHQDFDTCWSEVFGLITNIGKRMNLEISYPMFNESAAKCFLNEDEIRYLDQLLTKLFNLGCIEFGFRAANIFSYRSHDLDIIYTCHSIAGGRSIEEFKTCSVVLANNIPMNSLEPKEVLERLCLFSTVIGETTCQRILLYYKISMTLGLPYITVFKDRNEIDLLRSLISFGANNDTLTLAKEFVSLTGIRDDCVAEFVSIDIFQAIRSGIEPADEASVSECETTNFLLLMRLLNNPTVLGKKLLEFVENGSTDDLPASVAVELCIKAHDCFTLSSDVEGIAVVLRNVKNLVTKNLSENKDFHSMIRLLKGIGRYSEMTYIFDILKENDAFEMLLGKGIEKVPQLRIALLDSVKSDKETYTLIALNFSMHREIAEMMESAATKTIKGLHFRRQQTLMSYKAILERVLEEMIDASESYTKAGCYNKADLCAKRAELIALQINYLPSGVVVLNLTENAVAKFVCEHPRFSEALIVADAYQHQRSWDQALFNNVVVRGDWNYYREYSSQIKITPTNFDEIVAIFMKYKNVNFLTMSSEKQAAVNANILKLLTHLDDVRKQYEYSVLLDFHELANNLLKGESGAFLRDLKRLNQL